MKWDWMILPGATLRLQLLLDLIEPLLIVFLFRTPRYYTGSVSEDSSKPKWVRNLWKYILGFTYVWFFSATIWHFYPASFR
jgi:hypothetical protein